MPKVKLRPPQKIQSEPKNFGERLAIVSYESERHSYRAQNCRKNNPKPKCQHKVQNKAESGGGGEIQKLRQGQRPDDFAFGVNELGDLKLHVYDTNIQILLMIQIIQIINKA